MGGAQSHRRFSFDGKPEWERIEGLEPPEFRRETIVFHVQPEDTHLRKKSSRMTLEVGFDGFRLLRPNSGDPYLSCKWGNIHSWSSSGRTFSFSVYDDRAKELVQYCVALNEPDLLFRKIQEIVEVLLEKRKRNVLSAEAFAALCARLANGTGDTKISLLRESLEDHFMTSLQGQLVVKLMDNSFDKVEAASLLHSKLIDMNHFQIVLDVLDCEEDRSNVWHRIAVERKIDSNPIKRLSTSSE